MSEEEKNEIDFMPARYAAYRRTAPRHIPVLMLSAIAFCIVFLIWANYAELDEVARGECKIIPSSNVQKIGNLEGGIIQHILVREGQIVQKDQILLRLDPTIVEARLKEGRENYYRYLADVERLKALTENQNFVLSAEIQQKAPDVGREATERFNARLLRKNQEIEISQKELDQKTEELNELKARFNELTKSVDLSQQAITLQEPLVSKGLSSKMEFLKSKRDLNDAQGHLESVKINITKAEAAVHQASEKLKQVPIIFQNEDYNELREASNKLAQAQGTFTSQEDISSRTEIRSPVRGVVKDIHLTTIGGIIKPGEEIMEIVPLDDTLLVEVNIKPSDIAFLHPGQPATLKITAFDYSVYGGLHAQLVDISPDTVIDEKDPKRQSYYKVKLRTTNLKFTKSKDEKTLIPGMIVTADIKTGKKTVMHYLLKPIIKAKDEALTER